MYKENTPKYWGGRLISHYTHNCIYDTIYRIVGYIDEYCGNDCEIIFQSKGEDYIMELKIPNNEKGMYFFIPRYTDYIFHLYDGKRKGSMIHKNQNFVILLEKALLFEGIKRTTRFDKIRNIVTLAKSKNIGLALTLLNSLT